MSETPRRLATADDFARRERELANREREHQIHTGLRSRFSEGVSRVAADRLAENSTSSAAFVSLSGPSVTIQVPQAGAWVWVFAEVEMRTTNAGFSAKAGVAITGQAAFGAGQTFSTGYTLVGLGGPTNNAAGASLIGRFLPGGSRTIELVYASDAAAATCFVRNRRMMAGLF